VLLLVVWIAVAVLAVLVLGALGYLTLGAVQRLRREVAGLQRELRPVLEQVQQTAARATDTRNLAGGGSPRSGAGNGRIPA
jgi:hypothetical protein